MKHPDQRLSEALRELAASTSQEPSPQLGSMLKEAFRRHHTRRRRLRNIRLGAIAISVAMLVALPLLRKFAVTSRHNNSTAVRTIHPEEVTSSPDVAFSASRPAEHPKVNSQHPVNSLASAGFVALPSFDAIPADDELRVVRLELPVKDLRLVGVPLGEEVPERHRVVADFVIGQDRTPYAVRLVNYRVPRGE